MGSAGSVYAVIETLPEDVKTAATEKINKRYEIGEGTDEAVASLVKEMKCRLKKVKINMRRCGVKSLAEFSDNIVDEEAGLTWDDAEVGVIHVYLIPHEKVESFIARIKVVAASKGFPGFPQLSLTGSNLYAELKGQRSRTELDVDDNINDEIMEAMGFILFVEAKTIDDSTLVLSSIASPGEGISLNFNFYGDDGGFAALLRAIRTTKTNSLDFAHETRISTSQLVQLAEAGASNSNITRWCFVGAGMNSEAVPGIAAALSTAPQVTEFMCCYAAFLTNDKAGSENIALLADALRANNKTNSVKSFKLLFSDSDGFKGHITKRAAVAMAKLKMANPDVYFADESEQCEARTRLDAQVAAESVYNVIAQQTIEKHQRLIMKHLLQGDSPSVINDSISAVIAASAQEHRRLLAILPDLLNRYKLPGGWSFLQKIASFKDESFSGQSVPSCGGIRVFHNNQDLAIEDEDHTQKIKLMLARARYEDEKFRKLVIDVYDSINSISAPELINNVYSAQGVDFQPGIDCLCVEIKGLSFYSDNIVGERFNGTYIEFSTFNGRPVFRLSDPTTGNMVEPPLYFLYDSAWYTWAISRHLEDRGFDISFYETLDRDFYKSVGQTLTTDCLVGVSEPAGKCTVSCRAAKQWLKEVLKLHVEKRWDRAEDGKLPVSFANGSWCLASFGPPKNLARCIEKGAQGLKDLNRCTFTFESMAFLALCVHMVIHTVKLRGGRIVALKNKFVQVGGFHEPPNIHLNCTLDDSDWIVEFQFTLSEFLSAKEYFHKYYDIQRAEDLSTLFQPVFEPMPQESYSPEQGVSSSSSDGKPLYNLLNFKVTPLE